MGDDEAIGQFYQSELSFGQFDIVVAAEPHRPRETAVVTLDVCGHYAYLTPDEAWMVWKCLGDAIENAAGRKLADMDIPAGTLVPTR